MPRWTIADVIAAGDTIYAKLRPALLRQHEAGS